MNNANELRRKSDKELLQEYMRIRGELIRSLPGAQKLNEEHIKKYLEGIKAQGEIMHEVFRRINIDKSETRFSAEIPGIEKPFTGPSGTLIKPFEEVYSFLANHKINTLNIGLTEDQKKILEKQIEKLREISKKGKPPEKPKKPLTPPKGHQRK